MRKGNKIPQAANTAPNTAAMVTHTQRQRTSHTTNATSTPSTKFGGRSGYATSWKLSTRSGTNGDRTKKEVEQQGWILVDKGSKLKHKPDQYYIELSNAYSSLAEFLADSSPDDAPTSAASLFKLKSTNRWHQWIQRKIKKKLKDATDTDDAITKQYIDMAEDEHTEMAKSNKSNVRRVAIDTAHSKPTKPSALVQQIKNLG